MVIEMKIKTSADYKREKKKSLKKNEWYVDLFVPWCAKQGIQIIPYVDSMNKIKKGSSNICDIKYDRLCTSENRLALSIEFGKKNNPLKEKKFTKSGILRDTGCILYGQGNPWFYALFETKKLKELFEADEYKRHVYPKYPDPNPPRLQSYYMPLEDVIKHAIKFEDFRNRKGKDIPIKRKRKTQKTKPLIRRKKNAPNGRLF